MNTTWDAKKTEMDVWSDDHFDSLWDDFLKNKDVASQWDDLKHWIMFQCKVNKYHAREIFVEDYMYDEWNTFVERMFDESKNI